MPMKTTDSSRRSPVKFRYIDNISISCDISKTDFEKNITYLFTSYYKMQAIGYTQDTQEFWCKKITNNSCVLYFTCYIQCDGDYKCSIIIKPLVGNENEFKKLEKNIKNYITLYKNFDDDVIEYIDLK
jgi:hypothetical protein